MRIGAGLRIAVGAMLGMALVGATAATAAAAPPPPLGDDGSYRAVRSWDTTQSDPITFLVPSTILATTGGEIYGIANYSSGSSQAVIRDSDTGTRLASWFNPDSYPTGLALDPDQNPLVLERNTASGVWEVVAYSPTGSVLNTTVLEGSESANFVGLALDDDGTIFTIEAATAPTAIASFTSAGAARPVVPLPDLQVSGAAFNLNLASDGMLHFAAYDTLTGGSVLVTADPASGDLTSTPIPDIAQTTLGPGDRLFTLQYDSTVVITGLDGTIVETIPPSAYAPWIVSPIGVTAAPDGTVFVSGYASDSATGNTIPGITALQPLRSPDVVGSQYSGLVCDEFSATVQATGTPPPSFFEIVAGSLPPGIALDGDAGMFGGVPSDEGSYSFSIRALNGVSPTPDTTTDDIGEYTIEVSLKSFVSVDPTIVGTPLVGSELTAETPEWVPAPTFRLLQWLRDGQPIPGATGNTYTATEADLDHDLRVAVTGSSECYETITATSAAVRVVAPSSPSPSPSPTPSTVPTTPGAAPGTGLAGTGSDLEALRPFLALALSAVLVGTALLVASAVRRRYIDHR